MISAALGIPSPRDAFFFKAYALVEDPPYEPGDSRPKRNLASERRSEHSFTNAYDKFDLKAANAQVCTFPFFLSFFLNTVRRR